VAFARDTQRRQYHATAMLERLAALATAKPSCLLGVTAVDLFVPVFTFVFGEAQLERQLCARDILPAQTGALRSAAE
jgi:archaemetzincin